MIRTSSARERPHYCTTNHPSSVPPLWPCSCYLHAVLFLSIPLLRPDDEHRCNFPLYPSPLQSALLSSTPPYRMSSRSVTRDCHHQRHLLLLLHLGNAAEMDRRNNRGTSGSDRAVAVNKDSWCFITNSPRPIPPFDVEQSRLDAPAEVAGDFTCGFFFTPV